MSAAVIGPWPNDKPMWSMSYHARTMFHLRFSLSMLMHSSVLLHLFFSTFLLLPAIPNTSSIWNLGVTHSCIKNIKKHAWNMRVAITCHNRGTFDSLDMPLLTLLRISLEALCCWSNPCFFHLTVPIGSLVAWQGSSLPCSALDES